jgi:hypothetical protein
MVLAKAQGDRLALERLSSSRGSASLLEQPTQPTSCRPPTQEQRTVRFEVPSHRGTLAHALGGFDRGEWREGDCHAGCASRASSTRASAAAALSSARAQRQRAS